jgi:hypothetical protein
LTIQLFALLAMISAAGSAAAAQRDAGLSRQEAEGAERGDSEEAKRQLQIHAREMLIAHQKWADLVAEKLIRVLPADSRPDPVPYIGLRVADHKAKENALLAQAVGLAAPKRPFVYSVDPTGPAGEAGLQPGDQVLEIAEEPVRDAKKFYKVISRSDLQFPLRIRALRGDQRVDFEVQEGYRPRGLQVVVLGDPKQVYAHVDKREISLTTGMLDFLENDSELAIILGHEIGHVVRGHFSSSYQGSGFEPYFSQGLEQEADRYGLELAYTAGYDPAVGADLWSRFDSELPRHVADQWLLSHPPTRQRIAHARRVAEELKARSGKGT